ncbi:Plasmodium variant antigen protein Cir/Yir/Bir, putative [Plasmodium chabaudi adami]|uniref:Plasmodium variant antigen protein Cir/Yir/Bir, putative n=1 Tax=Plasmodium chabaudi adami TaxID=5826 RepID=A0A1C6W9L0_PLACE|nr:Plasmodium variant antigen protein Cir/Yir/Bir, putative [Plasmodium chabaudi adami]
METEKMCGLLIEADSYFDGKNVDTTKINEYSTIKGYCHNGDCKTNEELINALTTYIFKLFKDSIKSDEYNDYDEYFLLWISDKLFKIRKESKDKKPKKPYMDTITLNSAYERYLKNHKVKFGYWDFFDNIKGLKEANLEYMSEFYKLLNNICNTIVYYEKNDPQSKELSKYFNRCLVQYRTLYMNISECNSYLHLLKKLKGIYDDFRVSAISKSDSKSELATNLKKLTTLDGVEINGTKGFKQYRITKKKCNSLDKKNTKPKKAEKSSLQPSNQLKYSQHETSPSRKSETKEPKLQSSEQQTPEQPKDNQRETSQVSASKPGLKNAPKISDIQPKGPSIEQKDSGSDPGNQGASTHQGGDTGSGANDEPDGTDTEQGGSEDGLVNETGNPGNGKNLSKGGAGDLSDGDQGSQEGSDSSGGSGNEQGATDSTPGEKETQNPSWPPFDIKQYIFSIPLKGVEQLNKAINFYNGNREKIKEAIDTINSLYNTSVSNIKNNFYKYIEFFNNFINNLSNDFKQVESPPDSGDKKSGSGGTGGDPPTDNNPSQPQKDSDKQDSQTTKTTENSKEQNQVQKSSQDTLGSQNFDRTDQEESQRPVAAPVIIPENPGSEVKGNETTGIGNIYTFKEHKQIVISIIVLLIPIALAIIYKYLSFGRRNELKRKKNMEKVINLFGVNKMAKTVINSTDGKKQIQIIIKSPSRQKQIKKSINPAYGEKSPSLNIYKLMQADPVPFINLFFLLIFFVYKRKRDFIE